MSQIGYMQQIEMGSFEDKSEKLDEEIKKLPTLEETLEPHDKQYSLNAVSQQLKKVIVCFVGTEEEVNLSLRPLAADVRFNPKKPDCYPFRINEEIKIEGVTEKDVIGCHIGFEYPSKDDPNNLGERPRIVTFLEHKDGQTAPRYHDDWREALNDFFKMK